VSRSVSATRSARTARVLGGSRPVRVPVLLAVGLIALAVAGCMPTPASAQGKQISDLYSVFLVGGVIVTVIVWGLVTWSILRYRRRGDGLPVQTHGNMRVEAIWTLIPAATVLVLFVLTLQTLAAVNRVDPGGVNLHVTAFRWQWQATYPDAGVTITGTTAQKLEVVLPVNTPIHVTLESLDVNHAFYVPAFLFKRDAIPGRPNTFDITVTAPGVYPGSCAEFCGIGHDQMLFTIRGVDMATYEAWLAAHATPGSAAP
jgi:cytochrome c oxidase subunit 2